jgi:hypothetical protein
MATTVCLFANTIGYPTAGGHLWAYLNWALGLRALGCRLIWLEAVDAETPRDQVVAAVTALRNHLEPYGLRECLALSTRTGQPVPVSAGDQFMNLEAASDADLLLNMGYGLDASVVGRFRRSALIDIDPGLLQMWLKRGLMTVAKHDLYFTIGETVGRPGHSPFVEEPQWLYTPPCVALDWWSVAPPTPEAPFTTVSQWYGDEWVQDEESLYRNDKRSGFLPFLSLPRSTSQPMELTLCLTGDDDPERRTLVEHGWRVRNAVTTVATPWDYQRYIRTSLAEFSCAKPSYVRLQNAWISDRTLCYLASGRPAVVEHTGPSRFLPSRAGLFRFRTLEEATECLRMVVTDYEHQTMLARALAEEHFDARAVVGRVLERAFP